MTAPADHARQLLRSHLMTAMRSRDRTAAAALRSAISAIDQAEAVPAAGHDAQVGLHAEVARHRLEPDQVLAAIAAEVTERDAAVKELRAHGRDEAAEEVEAELAALHTALDELQASGPLDEHVRRTGH